MRRYVWLGLMIGVLALGVGWWLRRPEAASTVQVPRLKIANAFDAASSEGFARADAPRTLRFPDDHGPHREYQTEWWYFTGNLRSADGREWGYEFTIFRNSLQAQAVDRASSFGTNDIFLGHFALTDVAAKTFYAGSRTQRGGKLDLAGAQIEPSWNVFVDNWQISGPRDILPQNGQPGAPVRITATHAGVSVDLEVRALLEPVLQGQNGRVQKGPDAGIASYYYSIPRWATTGSIGVKGATVAVTGESWMDHEWMTTAIAPGNVGWDWFALRLADGRSLMWYQFLKADGSAEATYSVGSLVNGDGSERVTLLPADVQVTVLDRWKSPTSGASYPAHWRIQIPKYELDLTVQPLVADQELRVGLTYWEGAVAITGTAAGQAVQGRGYVELAGYADLVP